jgi:hypothetical protein
MFNFHASKQLHAVREQLKEMEQKYKKENKSNLRDPVMHTTQINSMQFEEEEQVSVSLSRYT